MVAQSPPADYVVGPQDVLAVQVFDQPDLGGKYTVETDGTFSFPLIGRVTAGGLTLRKVESELKKQLADGYFTNPQVTVAVERVPQPARVRHGRGAQPGTGVAHRRHDADRGARAGRVHAALGLGRDRHRPSAQGTNGPTLPNAGSDADILRARIRDLESGRRKQNIELRDGDTIFVPRAESVYVFGEVKSPGAYIIQNDTTVLQALSLAGGVSEDGAMNRIKIVRLVNGVKSELKASLGDPVKPGDTIMIPRKYF